MPLTLVTLKASLAFVALVLSNAPLASPRSQPVPPERVAWIVLVDDLHLDFRDTGRIRQLLQTILNEVVQEGDRVAIRTTGPSSVLTDFGSGDEVLPSVKKLTGGGLRPTEIKTLRARPDRDPDELRLRTRLALSSATVAAALLGQAGPTRRVMLYVSNGYPLEMTSFLEARALVGVAGANEVRIFAIDGASLDERSIAAADNAARDTYRATARDALQFVAEAGGGEILSAQDLQAALQQVSGSVRR
jgi:hypothetical protein